MTETIPVAASGDTVLLFPKWLPGTHSPSGEIGKIAGLTFSAAGHALAWERDPLDVSAFHVDVPPGARELTVAFQFVSPVSDDQGRRLMTSSMLSLQWNSLLLFPAGYYARGITVEASATYPHGWKSATALAPGLSGDHMSYPPTDLETLIDSPAIAGLNMRSEELAPRVHLNIAADDPANLVIAPEQLDAHRQLIDQAVKLFGTRHYDHYDFLLTLSSELGSIALEHHRSSEDGTAPDYFTGWDSHPGTRDLLPHEFVHSWNGKYRTPAELWTPDYIRPMRGNLLWVYEGLTQFWGIVLEARSGLAREQDALDVLAYTAARVAAAPGRDWRPLEDTTQDDVLGQHGNMPWMSYQRFLDYYTEGALIWLDADQLIRERSGRRKSLDDFALLFFSGRDRDWGTVTYHLEDVVQALNQVLPYDWTGFFQERIYRLHRNPPLDGLARGGFRLAFQDKPTPFLRAIETSEHFAEFSFSLGLRVTETGDVSEVRWGGPAFDAGLTTGAKIVTVGNRSFSIEALKQAITGAAVDKQPISLLVKTGDLYRNVLISWTGGLRYPVLEKTAQGPAGLDLLLKPRP